MGTIVDQFATAFRDFVTPGVSGSGQHEVVKSDVRAIGPLIEAALGNASLGGMVGVIKSTRALLNADLAHLADKVAVVYGDATDANNDLYIKVGGSGAGSWTLTTVLHGIVQSVLALDADITTGTSTVKAPTVKQMVDHQLAQNEALGRTRWGMDWQLPSSSRRGKLTVVQADRYIIDVRPGDAHYRDGYTRQYDDIVRFEMINYATRWHGRPASERIFTITSMWTRFAGEWVAHANFSWNDVIGGSNTNNGQIPSIMDPAYFIGPTSAGYAAILAAGGSGPGHGRITQGASMGLSTTGGIRNGAAITDGTNIRDVLKVGDVVEFETLTFDQTWNYLAHDSSYTAGVMNIAHFFNVTADRQLAVSSSFAVAASPSTSIGLGVSGMMAYRWPNRVQSRLRDNTTVNTAEVVGLQDSSIHNMGDARRITGFRSDKLGHAFDIEFPATYIQFRRNGVETACPAIQVLDEVAGPKARFYTHAGGGVLVDETGNTLSQYCIYNGVRANGA